MTIAEARERCKGFAAQMPRDALIVAVLILASSVSFGLGYLAGLDARKGSGAVIEGANPPSPEDMAGAAGQVIASKNGTKYYFLWCAGANRISDANKVQFASASDAEAQGYAPAADCKGL